jgi:hypothetical protein
MKSGSGSTANFAFNGEHEVRYRLQFRWNGGAWSTSGCSFILSQTLASSSSVACNEGTSLWTSTVCVENLSDVRTYFATIQVGNVEDSAYIGPGEEFCADNTASQGGKLDWKILIGGKLFTEGTTGKLGSCGEVFVPEPGTLALLGSGLPLLAGYAGLKLRRARTRQ